MRKPTLVLFIIAFFFSPLSIATTFQCSMKKDGKAYFYCGLESTNYKIIYGKHKQQIESYVKSHKLKISPKADDNFIGPHMTVKASNLAPAVNLKIANIIGDKFQLNIDDDITVWKTKRYYWFVLKVKSSKFLKGPRKASLISSSNTLHVSIARARL